MDEKANRLTSGDRLQAWALRWSPLLVFLLVTLPLVLPPTVTGYYLIVLLGRRGVTSTSGARSPIPCRANACASGSPARRWLRR